MDSRLLNLLLETSGNNGDTGAAEDGRRLAELLQEGGAAVGRGLPEILQAREETSHLVEEDTSGSDSEGSTSNYDSEEDNPYKLSEEDLKGIVNDNLADRMDKNDPERMKLDSEELEWALDIRAAIKADPELDNPSDYMVSQLAIVLKHGEMGRAQGIGDALNRARGLQAFRQEHDILDTFQDACRAIKTFVDLLPGLLLSWSFSEPDGTWVAAFHLTKADLDVLNTPAKIKAYCAAFYYLHHAQAPDLETVRKGVIFLIECEGVGIAFKTSFKIWLQVDEKCNKYYPELSRGKHYRTNVFFNTMASISKKTILPEEMAERLEFGLTSDITLDALFSVPSAEAATQRALHNVIECLKKRYAHEKLFTIPQPSQSNGRDDTS